MRHVQIGVITTYDAVDERVEEMVRELARELVAKKCVVITGGNGGLMKVLAEEISRLNGICVGILPSELEELSYSHPLKHHYNTVEIRTGMSYAARSSIVVRSSDAIILVAGGAGTLTELAMAYNMAVPVIVLESSGMLASKLRSLFPDGYLDHRKIVKLEYARTPREAVEMAYVRAIERLKVLGLSEVEVR
ncbi:MAG: TIGR00725 family protein [Candidatus Nezhaarchaeales archaeon]